MHSCRGITQAERSQLAAYTQMNNAPKPNIKDLPTKAQLFRSSIIAGIGAVAILIETIATDFEQRWVGAGI